MLSTVYIYNKQGSIIKILIMSCYGRLKCVTFLSKQIKNKINKNRSEFKHHDIITYCIKTEINFEI